MGRRRVAPSLTSEAMLVAHQRRAGETWRYACHQGSSSTGSRILLLFPSLLSFLLPLPSLNWLEWIGVPPRGRCRHGAARLPTCMQFPCLPQVQLPCVSCLLPLPPAHGAFPPALPHPFAHVVSAWSCSASMTLCGTRKLW